MSSLSIITLPPAHVQPPALSASAPDSARGYEHGQVFDSLALSLVNILPPAYTLSATLPPYVEHEEDPNTEEVPNTVEHPNTEDPNTAEHPNTERHPDSEPLTMAQLLFQYGFMFPLFWFVGAFVCLHSRPQIQAMAEPVSQILTLPLSAPASWEETKTVEERNALLKTLREAEVKWSWRCLYASLIFFIVLAATVATVTVILVTKQH